MLKYIFLFLTFLGFSLENMRAEMLILKKDQFEIFEYINPDESEENERLGVLHSKEHESHYLNNSNQKHFGSSNLNSIENSRFHFLNDLLNLISAANYQPQKSETRHPQGNCYDWKNTKNKSAFAENLELVNAWKKLGDHPNRTNVNILQSRKAFDDIDASFGKNNPHTGTEMFDPETGGYVVTHPGHNVTVGDIDSRAEFTIAESFGRDGKRVTLLDENLPDGVVTPDASIDGLGIFDFKNISPNASNIRNNVRNKIVDVNRQADNIAINLGDKPGIDIADVNNGILDALSTPGSHPTHIGITYPDGTSKILTSAEFLNGSRF
ncbi:MAG: hypothetical protein AAFX87_31650 [Bacteroidota bacterium]